MPVPRVPEQSGAVSQHQPGPATFTRAPKGKACLNCRRRKLKCDCAHPVCNQCVRFGREKDCEYSEKDQRSRTEILEENIATLQARVQELEGKAGAAQQPPFSSVQDTDWTGVTNDLRDFSMSTQLRGRSKSSSPLSSSSIEAEPTPAEARTLIETFLTHGLDLGFFLNTPRFLSWALLDSSSSFPPPLDGSDFLLSVIYAWGAVVISDEHQKTRRDLYLERALQDVHKAEQRNLAASTGEHDSRPDIVHLIQSHVLLANYFFYDGQFLEGRQHVASAVSLVSFYQLHKIRSPRPLDPSNPRLIRAAVAEYTLQPPADLVDEGERTHAFWHVYILDKIWSALLGCSSLLVEDGSPANEIDTPWPLTMEQYAEGVLPPGYGSTGRTCQTFIATRDMHPTTPLSPIAMRAKVAALISRAVWLASTCSQDSTMRQIHASSFEAIDKLFDASFLALPSIETAKAEFSPDVLRHILITLCLTRMGVYQLHYPFVANELESAVKSMSACKTIIASVEAVPADVLTTTDPMLLVLLTIPTEVVTSELIKIASQNADDGSRPLLTCVHPHYLVAHLDETSELIRCVSPHSGLAVIQLESANAIRSALAGIQFDSSSRMQIS